MKSRIKRTIAFVLALIIFWQVIPADIMETFATQEPKLHLVIKENGAPVDGFHVEATVSSSDASSISFEYVSGKYISNQSVVSANDITCKIKINKTGYEPYEKDVKFIYNSETSAFEADEIDMSSYHQFTVSGNANGWKYVGWPTFWEYGKIANVSVDAYRLDENTNQKGDWIKSTDTGSSGSYELSLIPGNYVLEFSHNHYATHSHHVEVQNSDVLYDAPLQYKHKLRVKQTLQSKNSSVNFAKISIVDTYNNPILPNDDGVYEVIKGTTVVLTVEPKEGYRLTDAQANAMVSHVSEDEVDDGSSYSVVFGEDNWPADEEYVIDFEKESRPVIKYNGSRIYYCRQGENATVSANGAEFTVECDSAYYVSDNGNDTLVELPSDGTSKTYRFQSNEEQMARVTVSGDGFEPSLDIIVSDNNILWGYVEEDGKYVDVEEGGQNYWYINDNKVVSANAIDGETGIEKVYVKIDNDDVYDLLYSHDSVYNIDILYSYINSKGSNLSIIARDNAGNEKKEDLYVFGDKVAPSVSENLVISENTIQYFQNGKRFVGKEEIKFTAKITDNWGIRNAYYLITENEINTAKELEQNYYEGKFTKLSKDIITSEEIDVEVPANLSNKKTGRWFAYVLADDFALNMDFNKVGKSDFEVDADAPTISNLKDISAHNSRYKRDTDEIKLSATFTDALTPSGMKYHVTEPKKLPANQDLSKLESPYPTMEAADREMMVWTAFGDENETKRSYENISVSVNNPEEAGSYVVWVYAKDGCENVSEGEPYVFHIDNQKPNMTTLAFDVKEDGNPFFDWLMKIGNFFRKDATKVPNQKNDRAQTVTIKLKADDKEPTDDIYALGTNTGLESVEIYFVLGEKQEYYETYKDSIESKTQREMPEFTHTAKLIEKDEINGEYTYELNLPKGEVFYRLMAVAKDYAGNCNYMIPTSNEAYKSDLVMLDQVLPTIEMNLTSQFATPDYKNGNKYWYSENKKVTYDVQIKDTGAGLFQARYTINDKEYAKNLYVTDSTTNITSNDKKQLTVNKDAVNKSSGKVTFHAEVQDNAGNMAELEKSVYIDLDEPVIQEVVFADKFTDDLKVVPTQYGFFFRDKTTVEVKVTDYIGKTKNLGSGVKKVTYYLLDCDNKMTPEKSISLTKNKDNVYTGKFVIPKGFKGQIYLKAEDNTGQATDYQSPKGTVIEGAAEHATHSKAEIKLPETSYTDEEGNPLYNHLPTIQYVTKDTKSGILQNVWSVKPFHLGSNEAEGVLDVTSNYDEAKGKFDPVLSGDIDWTVSKKLDLNLVTTANRTYSVKNQMNHIQAELQLTDNAGNKTKKESKVFSVDTTNPEIEVEYDNNDVQNEKYYKEPRVATITVKERNFSTEGVEMIITGDGAKIGEWQHHAGGGCDGTVHTDECTNVCNVTFDEDEEYTFTINCTDRAGNEGSYGQVDEFVIDLTNPVIQVTYDNNDARNGSYYKEARTATISIEETNFDEERTLPTITAKLQDTSIEAPVVSAFTTVEDMNTATVTYDKDGDYTFNIEVTDLAGNEADIFVQESFTIDMTAPELVVEGVEDGSANKGVVQPIITYTDVNMDEESVDIILTGANLGKVDFGKVETKVENGKKVDLGDFKHEQEVDDLYTLETVIIDMAGNEVTDTRTFSVNRFGSVYVYDDDTKDLMDDFYTNKEKDLVITEINVDTLEFVEIDSSIDGEITTLEEGKDYEVKKAYTDKQWRAYEYHIPATNFEKEGAYVVTIYSEDRAENKSSNKAKGKELNFVVDKTAPTIVVGGIEDGGQYREANREITLDVEDNVLLKTVDVYVNGAIVKTVAQEELLTENGRIKVNLKGSNKKQVLTVQSKDAAGNHAESKAVSFLITPNIFVQWYTNKPIFIGSILVMAGAVGFIFFRRRKLTVPPSTTA